MSAAFTAVGLGRGKPEEAGLDPNILEDHRQRIHAHMDRGVFPGMAECIVAQGKVVYLDLCGLSDKEHGTKMTESTLFRGYSMMKPITAVAFFTLVEEGLARLDDPVSRYLPQFGSLKVRKKSGKGLEPLKRPMTLRHLLMHTSGIGYGPGVPCHGDRVVARSTAEKTYKDIHLQMDSGEIDSLEKLCDALCLKPLLFQPGSAYEYGLSFDVLGRVMEIVSGKSLRRLVQDCVLTPVGMGDSAWDVSRAGARQICGYYRIMRTSGSSERWLQRLDGDTPKESAYVRGSASNYSGRAGVPAGGGFWGTFRTALLFSMRDIALFCQMLLNDGVAVSGTRILKASTVRALRRNWFQMRKAVDKPNPPGWTSDAVGWNPLGHVQLSGPQAGAQYMGGMSYFWMDPRRKIAAAIMTETYWQVQPLGWKGDRDTMETVLERAIEAGAAKKRKAAPHEPGKDVETGRTSKARRTA